MRRGGPRGQIEKLQQRLANNQKNVSFDDLLRVVAAYGYVLQRVRGSHLIFRHPVVETKLNLQPDGNAAKPYQVRDFLRQVERYNLQLQDRES